MTEYMYNCLANFMVVMKSTIGSMKKSIRKSCNSGKYTLSLGAY